MAYTFKKNLVSSSKYSIKCPYSMSPIGICIHNTSNNASAENEVKYMINNNNQTSYHVAVDEKHVIQAIPFNRNAWACGDGATGDGNRKYISIEICRSTGDVETFKKCEQNCAIYVAYLLKSYGWTIKNIKRHKDFSGKNCPHKTMELGWQRFLNMVQKELDRLNAKQQTQQTTTSKTVNYQIRVTTSSLNVRQEPNANATVKTTIRKHEVYTIIEEKNGWGLLKSKVGWINLDKAYVEKVTETTTTFKEYKVRITTDVLNVRKYPTTDSSIAQQVKKGQVYTIVDEQDGFGKLKSGSGWISLFYTERV